MNPSRIEQAYRELLLIAKYYNTKVVEHICEEPRHLRGHCSDIVRYLRQGRWEWRCSINIRRPVEKSIPFLAVFAHELGHTIIRKGWKPEECAEKAHLYCTAREWRKWEEYTAWLHADSLAERLGFYNRDYLARREESLKSYGIIVSKED